MIQLKRIYDAPSVPDGDPPASLEVLHERFVSELAKETERLRIGHGLSDPEEALKLANASPSGLVAGIWTRDIDKAHGLAARLKAGQIYINNYFGGAWPPLSAATRKVASGAKKTWRP